MYAKEDDEGKLNLFGFKKEDFADDVVGVWSCNWLSVCLFIDLSTQWRTGFSGVLGLDYNVLPILFGIHQIEQDKQAEVLADIQLMERAALVEIYRV